MDSQKNNWDELLPTVLYAYRTKAHAALGISPYELLYGLSPVSHRPDILQQLGEKLASERLYFMQNRQITDELKLRQVDLEPHQGKRIPVGTKVIRLNHIKKNKLDKNYKPKIFTVLASFKNNLYLLADPRGIRLKRAVNGVCLKKFVQRSPLSQRLQDKRGRMT